jgi:hypothetical protein
MKYKKFKLSLVLLLGLSLIGLQGQESIPTSGGNTSSNEGSLSYTVGQIIYSTNTGTNGSVSQGVQQPYEFFIVTGINEVNAISLNCSAYPNPTTNFIILKVEDYHLPVLSYRLYNKTGKIFKNQKVESNETIISMETLIPATYFLKVSDNKKEVKTFKIIKK